MKSRSFKEWSRNRAARPSAADFSPEEREAAERLARMAQPYAGMSEAELLRQMKRMKNSPETAAFLRQHPLDEVARQLAPALDPAQKQKLAAILRALEE